MIKLAVKKTSIQMISRCRGILSWLTTTEIGIQCLGFMVIPLVLIAFYLLLLSPDRYVSNASILIKETDVPNMQAGLLEGLGLNAGGISADEQLLQAYITSPNLFAILDQQLGIKDHYSGSLDFLFGISEGAAQEDFINFYQKYVKVEPSSQNGLLTISVQAYTPEFAKKLAEALLMRSEFFINEASQMIAKREMQFALDEINRNQELLKSAKRELLQFQNEHHLVSPTSEEESLVALVFQLEGELAKTEAEISQHQNYLNANAPQLVALKNRADALKKEIEAQKQRIIGSTGKGEKLNKLSAQFQELTLNLELATTLYTSALSAYELARVQASKQLKHLIIASNPPLPEKALYPRRIYWLITWAIFLGAFWGIARMVIASVKEHKD